MEFLPTADVMFSPVLRLCKDELPEWSSRSRLDGPALGLFPPKVVKFNDGWFMEAFVEDGIVIIELFVS